MYSSKLINEIRRLNFENFLWIIFIILCLLNIYGDNFEKKYLETNNYSFQRNANQVFEFTLIVTLFIYIYFFMRNYKSYKNANELEKERYKIKVLGSIFLIGGIICLIYFQTNQKEFIGSPSL